MKPSELSDFMDLPQPEKCMTMFTTLNNHISALHEVKWLIRILCGGAFAAVVVKLII